jgi:lysozyme family protein
MAEGRQYATRQERVNRLFERALEFVLAREGGFSDDPADPGGATNFGITQATYDAWRRSLDKDPYPVLHIVPAEVEVIYRDRYWEPPSCPLLPWPLALVHFDGAVNHGTDKRGRWRCAKFLQTSLQLKPDGFIGPKTRQAIDAMIRDMAVYAVSRDILWQRLAFYRKIVNYRKASLKFLPGWIRRMEHLYEEVVAG